eukprot:Sspe_Gene.9383::Locus_3151_Transcript_1_3_Confidence_0.400_Length_1397::g.9383::m.9383
MKPDAGIWHYELAAVLIQSFWRGHRVRRGLRKKSTSPAAVLASPVRWVDLGGGLGVYQHAETLPPQHPERSKCPLDDLLEGMGARVAEASAVSSRLRTPDILEDDTAHVPCAPSTQRSVPAPRRHGPTAKPVKATPPPTPKPAEASPPAQSSPPARPSATPVPTPPAPEAPVPLPPSPAPCEWPRAASQREASAAHSLWKSRHTAPHTRKRLELTLGSPPTRIAATSTRTASEGRHTPSLPGGIVNTPMSRGMKKGVPKRRPASARHVQLPEFVL